MPDFYRPFAKRSSGPWDAIVIGSGMGGMSCAAALAKCGKRVLVLEQHYVPGGFTHTFTRKGFTWDVGVHCVGEMGPRDMPGRLLSWLSEGKLEWAPMGPVYETFHFPGGDTYRFPDSFRAFKDGLLEKFPDEREAIDKYFTLIREVTGSARSFFLLRTMPEWVDRIGTRMLNKNKWWGRKTADVLDGITKNEKLKAVLTAQWGYYGATPSNSSFAVHALVARHYFGGGYFPVGGAGAIAERLLQVVSAAGGETLVRAPVEEVLVRGGRAVGVRMAGGEEILAPVVVSAAGVRLTVEKLVPRAVRDGSWAGELAGLKQSPAYVCLYLGFEGDIEGAGATKSNQWFFETWNMEDSDWDVTKPESVAPVLYLSFPSLKDPTHDPGPSNRHTGEVVTFVPWEAFAKWDKSRRGNRDTDYLAFKRGLEERMIAQLRRHVPKLMERVKYCELSTPLSTQFFTHAPQGAIYGLAPTPTRFSSTKLRTRTPIKNLYLAGGDVATLGVTGALIGGVLAAGTIETKILAKLR